MPVGIRLCVRASLRACLLRFVHLGVRSSMLLDVSDVPSIILAIAPHTRRN